MLYWGLRVYLPYPEGRTPQHALVVPALLREIWIREPRYRKRLWTKKHVLREEERDEGRARTRANAREKEAAHPRPPPLHPRARMHAPTRNRTKYR